MYSKKIITGYDYQYTIDTDGNIMCPKFWLKDGKRQRGPFCLHKRIDSSHGYVCVWMIRKGKRCKRYIHRLLANAFIPNPENKLCVNHKNGDKTDYRLLNLEWSTYSENNQHALDNGLTYRRKGGSNSRHKKVYRYDLQNNFLDAWCGVRQAARQLKLCPTGIGVCARGKQDSAYGYIWKYNII